jgi:hypothetical protein
MTIFGGVEPESKKTEYAFKPDGLGEFDGLWMI